MGAGAEIAAGIIGGLFDGAKTIYDIWNNERNIDYQKALQQEMFWREDTAVQRRMADLKAAGLNPNLAAGSAAAAGAVVGRSNTPSISGNPIGTALDMAQAVQQLRAQREQNEILKNEKDKSISEAEQAAIDANISRINFAQMLGYKLTGYLGDDGTPYIYHYDDGIHNLDEAPIGQLFKWQLQNNRNSADLLQRDVDFYTADKIMDYFGAGISAFSGIGSGYRAFKGKR